MLRGRSSDFGFKGWGSRAGGGRRSLEALPLGPKVAPFWDYLIEF